MTDDPRKHPEEGSLLAYLDGEMATVESEYVASHLRACWNCRMHADALQRTIVAYARYRDREPMPEPPRAWKDLGGDFRRFDESAAPPSLWTRLRSRTVLRIAGACGAAAVAAAAWLVLPRASAPAPKETAPATAAPTPGPREATPTVVRSAPRVPVPIVPESVPVASLHEEVTVVAALHRLDADLGEPIELVREADGRLRLRGVGLTPDRQNAIRDALSLIRGVELTFSNPAPDRTVSDRSSALLLARRPVAFAAELTKLLGSKDALERLTNAVLDSSDAALSRAYALRSLDQRFPATSALDERDRVAIENIRADHWRHFHESAAELRRLLNPVFAHVPAQPKPTPAATQVEAAIQVDRLLNAAFAGAHSSLSDSQLYAELEGWLPRLAEWGVQ